jgi:hypothetical protein
MTPKQLANKIRKLRPHVPLTSEFERFLRGDESNRVWYTSRKEHWLGWLREYDGPGAYNRQNADRSAEFIYNHIVCPPMVLWLWEASGVPKSKVAEAQRAALSSSPRLQSQSAAIRRIIPWEMIEARLDKMGSR